MRRSRYDELHDRYHTILKTKRGTRYEILAAVVFAALEQDAVVIHDLAVVGSDTGERHQIDVTIERGSARKRVLIECKDFDVRGRRVGLSVARDFWGAVDDIHPDESWIVTCNGFTKPAMRYAKGKGIKLATLRIFEEADWLGRIHTIGIEMTVVSPNLNQVSVHFDLASDESPEAADKLKGAPHVGMDGASQLFDGTSVRTLSAILENLVRSAAAGTPEFVEQRETPGGWVSRDRGGPRFRIRGYRMAVPVTYAKFPITMSVDRGAARLLLSDGAGMDFVIWDQTLRGYTIDEGGEIHLATTDKQAILQTFVTEAAGSRAPS